MNIFLNLDSSEFLIEYVYHDSGSPERINTNEAPFYFMENGHTNIPLLMNQDGFDNITNNTRNRSVAQIENNSKRFSLLTTNKLGQAYNDFDDKLTNTDSLPLSFSSTEGVIYDTVRVHFIQGFTFNDFFSGINLDIKVKDRQDKTISLLSAIYRVQDNYEIMNPNPFLYGGRQYSTYIEFKVPSLKYLIDSYITEFEQNNLTDILSYKITDGNGFYRNSLIEISAGKFSEISKINNQLYTNRISAESTSISPKDEFSDVGVFINESLNGDYIEFYGTHNGEIFGDYIQRLNNSNTGKYIAIHKLTITEQLPNTTGEYILVGKYNPLTNVPNLGATAFVSQFTDGDYWIATETGYSNDILQNVEKGNFIVYNPNLPSSIKVEVLDSFDIENYADIAQFIRTGEQEFIQDDNFEDPNYFRPVLKFGGSALSYKIDYMLKIFNINTNTTIEKFGSYVSFEPNKYGKELLKLNTRDNIQVFDVFNKKVINNIINSNNISLENNIESTNLYSKNITSFKQINSVYSGVTEVSINSEGKIVPSINPESITNIKGQGLTTVYISPFDTFLQFSIYEENESRTFRSIDLNKIGIIYLNFTNKDGEIIKITSTKNQNVDESKGQILFRIKPEIYNQIINSGNDVFFITSKVGDNSPESPLYTGKYKDYSRLSEDESNSLFNKQNEEIKNLKDEIVKLRNNINKKETSSNDKNIIDKSINIKKGRFNKFSDK